MKKCFVLFCIAALLLSAGLSGCSGREAADSPAPPPEETTPPADTVPSPEVKSEFTVSDYRQDYEQFWQELEENYPYLPYLEQQGLDLAGLKETYAQGLGRISHPYGFVVILRQVCAQLGYFAHLYVPGGELIASYQALDGDLRDTFAPWISTVDNEQTRLTYALISQYDKSQAESGGEESPADSCPAVETRYYPELKAAYFHFYTFDHAALERDADLVADYLSTLDEVEHILFDISGNPGGDSAYWAQNIVAPFGGSYTWEERYYFLDSPVSQKFFFDSGLFEPSPVSQLPEGTLPALAGDLGLAWYSSSATTLDCGQIPGEKVSSSARRWVITDSAVYSSAELFAQFCKATGWATLVGQQPSGDGGIEPVVIALEHTGVLVRFSAAVKFNPDGTVNAAGGTPPDYYPLQNETPLQACKRLLEQSA